MVFLSKLVIALISPLGTSLLLGSLALLLALLRWRRWSVAAGSVAVFWLTLWSLPVASIWIYERLEADYPPIAMDAVPAAQAIVVLGGGMVPSADGMVFPSLQSGADRMWHASRLFHAGKAPLIVLSGGTPGSSLQSEAQAMQTFLLDLGVPREALLLEASSANTSENAEYSAKLLAELNISSILLVTSAFHMSRAKGLFEAQGLQVTAAATDYQAKPASGWREWMPAAAALDCTARAFKELVGRLVGR